MKRMLAEKETLIDEYLKNPYAQEASEIAELTNYCKLLMPRSQEESKEEETKQEDETTNGGDVNQFQNDNVTAVVNKKNRDGDNNWTGMAQGGRRKRGRKRNRKNQAQK